MISVTINLDTSRFDRMMSDFPVRMAAAKRRALADIGTAVASRAQLAFRTASLRPAPWAPRKDAGRPKGRGHHEHPLLIRSGNLRQSITWRLNGSDSVVVGAPVKYAGYHQLGTKKMPARPFFPFDKAGRIMPAMERKIKGILDRVYRDELGKLGG